MSGKKITPTVAGGLCVEALKRLQGEQDVEVAHRMADELLCALLRDLGHAAVVDEWKKVPKWYA